MSCCGPHPKLKLKLAGTYNKLTEDQRSYIDNRFTKYILDFHMTMAREGFTVSGIEFRAFGVGQRHLPETINGPRGPLAITKATEAELIEGKK